METSAIELVGPTLRHIAYNIVHCLRNNQLKLTADKLKFVVYKLVRNDKSILYYQNDYVHVGGREDDFFETKTGSVYSNSNKLQLELFIKQGISKYDYDNETSMLIFYLSYLDQYCNEK